MKVLQVLVAVPAPRLGLMFFAQCVTHSLSGFQSPWCPLWLRIAWPVPTDPTTAEGGRVGLVIGVGLCFRPMLIGGWCLAVTRGGVHGVQTWTEQFNEIE